MERKAPSRIRHDGWTARRQLVFLRLLEAGGSVASAALHAGMAPTSAYRFRRRDPRSLFAQTWAYLDQVRAETKGHTAGREL